MLSDWNPKNQKKNLASREAFTFVQARGSGSDINLEGQRAHSLT